MHNRCTSRYGRTDRSVTDERRTIRRTIRRTSDARADRRSDRRAMHEQTDERCTSRQTSDARAMYDQTDERCTIRQTIRRTIRCTSAHVSSRVAANERQTSDARAGRRAMHEQTDERCTSRQQCRTLSTKHMRNHPQAQAHNAHPIQTHEQTSGARQATGLTETLSKHQSK